ncbi:MAG: hypothetical protein ACXAC5_01755 [Promethearchaeota archaeon]
MFLVVNAVYGYLTHLHSLPGIRRHNKRVLEKWHSLKPGAKDHCMKTIPKEEKGLGNEDLVQTLLYRLFLSLPIRIISFALGIIGVVLIFAATLRLRSNEPLCWGWMWHLPPERLARLHNPNKSATQTG